MQESGEGITPQRFHLSQLTSLNYATETKLRPHFFTI